MTKVLRVSVRPVENNAATLVWYLENVMCFTIKKHMDLLYY